MGVPPSPPVPPQPSAPVVVPKSFELYVDGARWVLAIIAGLLVFGFDAIKEHSGEGRALGIYAGSAALLGIAAGAALAYLLMSYNYASRRETGQAKDDPDVVGIKRASDRYFDLMIKSFLLGLACYVAFGAMLLWELREKEESVQVHGAGANGLVLQKGNRLWVLELGADGRPGWVPLSPPDAEAKRR